MTQHYKNLTVIHFDINAFYSTESTRESLLQVFDFKIVTWCLKALTKNWRGFVVFLRHLVHFKTILTFNKAFLVTHFNHRISAASRPAALVIARWAQEPWFEALTKIRWDHLVHVQAKREVDNKVYQKHGYSCIEWVAFVFNIDCWTSETLARTFVVCKYDWTLHDCDLGKQRC